LDAKKCHHQTCGFAERVYFPSENRNARMKTKNPKAVEQPAPVTPGISKEMVRQHAYEMFRDKLPAHPLTLEDWVLAEKDLVNSLETEEVQG
jgi:hypothetical protein